MQQVQRNIIITLTFAGTSTHTHTHTITAPNGNIHIPNNFVLKFCGLLSVYFLWQSQPNFVLIFWRFICLLLLLFSCCYFSSFCRNLFCVCCNFNLSKLFWRIKYENTNDHRDVNCISVDRVIKFCVDCIDEYNGDPRVGNKNDHYMNRAHIHIYSINVAPLCSGKITNLSKKNLKLFWFAPLSSVRMFSTFRGLLKVSTDTFSWCLVHYCEGLVFHYLS